MSGKELPRCEGRPANGARPTPDCRLRALTSLTGEILPSHRQATRHGGMPLACLLLCRMNRQFTVASS